MVVVVVRYNSMIVPFFFSFSFSRGVELGARTVHIFRRYLQPFFMDLSVSIGVLGENNCVFGTLDIFIISPPISVSWCV